MLITYTLNFMDKNALSNSANFDLREDNVRIDFYTLCALLTPNFLQHLVGNQYSWASGSVFYLGAYHCQPEKLESKY